MKTIYFLIIAIGFASCQSATDLENVSSSPALSPLKLEITKGKGFTIELPSDLVVDPWTPIHFSVEENLVYIYDEFSNRILTYSIATNKFESEILLEQKLPKYKGSGMTFINPDTIILYDYYRRKMCLLNAKGDVHKVVKLHIPPTNAKSKAWHPSPVVANTSPATIFNDSIQLVGYLPGEADFEIFETRFLRSSFTISDSIATLSMPYSDAYRNKNYGGFYFRTPYSTTNYQKNNLIVSLPASHELLVYDFATSEVKTHNASPPFQISIPSLRYPKNVVSGDNGFSSEHYSTNYSYKNIIYHPYKDCYIRILETPVEKKKLPRNRLAPKESLLLLYDSEFKFITMAEIENHISTDNFLITKDGIHFMTTLNKNENKTQYEFYKIN